MATKLIQDTTLTNIADAIREKTETTESLKPINMPEAIKSIEVSTEDVYETKYKDLVFDMISTGPKSSPEIYYTGHLKAKDVEELLQVAKEEGAVRIRGYAFASNVSDTDATLIIPEGYKEIGQSAFVGLNVKNLVIPSTIENIGLYAFEYAYNLENIYFKGTPSEFFANTAFAEMGKYDYYPHINLYVPWSEGQVRYAPWGLGEYSTIHYNYTFTGEEV